MLLRRHFLLPGLRSVDGTGIAANLDYFARSH